MEYLVVEYPRKRKVVVKDETIGYTNEVIELEAGPYTISLSGQSNYSPASRRVNLVNTSVLDPKTISFSPVG